MEFTERLFRTFATMNFIAFLFKSNLSYTFYATVCLSLSLPLPRSHGVNSPTPAFRPHVCPDSCAYLVNLPQSSPAVGISFCLIIVRLGHVLPVAREETCDASFYAPASRTGASGRVAVSFPQVNVQRDVYVSESKDFPMGAPEARERGRVNSPTDLPKVFRSNPSAATLA